MRQVISKEMLDRIFQMVKSGLASEEIAYQLNAHGTTTPNGMAWTPGNVGYYIFYYDLKKKAKRASQKLEKETSKETSSDTEKKIKAILALNLSKETMIRAITEVL